MANTNIADSEKIIVVLRLCMSDDGCILKREEGIKYAYELRVLINKEAMAAKAAAEAAAEAAALAPAASGAAAAPVEAAPAAAAARVPRAKQAGALLKHRLTDIDLYALSTVDKRQSLRARKHCIVFALGDQNALVTRNEAFIVLVESEFKKKTPAGLSDAVIEKIKAEWKTAWEKQQTGHKNENVKLAIDGEPEASFPFERRVLDLLGNFTIKHFTGKMEKWSEQAIEGASPEDLKNVSRDVEDLLLQLAALQKELTDTWNEQDSIDAMVLSVPQKTVFVEPSGSTDIQQIALVIQHAIAQAQLHTPMPQRSPSAQATYAEALKLGKTIEQRNPDIVDEADKVADFLEHFIEEAEVLADEVKMLQNMVAARAAELAVKADARAEVQRDIAAKQQVLQIYLATISMGLGVCSMASGFFGMNLGNSICGPDGCMDYLADPANPARWATNSDHGYKYFVIVCSVSAAFAVVLMGASLLYLAAVLNETSTEKSPPSAAKGAAGGGGGGGTSETSTEKSEASAAKGAAGGGGGGGTSVVNFNASRDNK